MWQIIVGFLKCIRKCSGTHEYYNIVGEERDIKEAARRIHAEAKHDARGWHIDATPHQVELLRRYKNNVIDEEA